MERLTNIQRIIRDFLIYCARRESTITYGELGANVGRMARGPWTADLCAITDYEAMCGRPDLTLVVVSEKTGFPTRYQGKRFDRKDENMAALYRKDLGGLFELWSKRRRGGAYPPECGLRDKECGLRDKRSEIANDGDQPLRMTTVSRQEREDQDFIDAITDWDWGDR